MGRILLCVSRTISITSDFTRIAKIKARSALDVCLSNCYDVQTILNGNMPVSAYALLQLKLVDIINLYSSLIAVQLILWRLQSSILKPLIPYRPNLHRSLLGGQTLSVFQ